MSGVGGIDVRNGERGLSKLEEDGERLRDVKVYGGIGRTAGRCLGRAIHHMPTKVGELGLALPLQAAEQLRWCGTRPGVDGCPLSSLQGVDVWIYGMMAYLASSGPACQWLGLCIKDNGRRRLGWPSPPSTSAEGGGQRCIRTVSRVPGGGRPEPHQQTDVTG